MIGVPELHLSISLLVVTLSIIQGAPPGSIDGKLCLFPPYKNLLRIMATRIVRLK